MSSVPETLNTRLRSGQVAIREHQGSRVALPKDDLAISSGSLLSKRASPYTSLRRRRSFLSTLLLRHDFRSTFKYIYIIYINIFLKARNNKEGGKERVREGEREVILNLLFYSPDECDGQG